MCLARKNLSPKARTFFSIGNLCLCAGLVLSIFDKDIGHQHAVLYNGLRGLLYGLAIGFNVGALRLSRRCSQHRASTESQS